MTEGAANKLVAGHRLDPRSDLICCKNTNNTATYNYWLIEIRSFPPPPAKQPETRYTTVREKRLVRLSGRGVGDECLIRALNEEFIILRGDDDVEKNFPLLLVSISGLNCIRLCIVLPIEHEINNFSIDSGEYPRLLALYNYSRSSKRPVL